MLCGVLLWTKSVPLPRDTAWAISDENVLSLEPARWSGRPRTARDSGPEEPR